MKRQLLHMVVYREVAAPDVLYWYARHVWVHEKGLSRDAIVANGQCAGVSSLSAREAVRIALRDALAHLDDD